MTGVDARVSDEFNADALDSEKWCDWVWSFPGRRQGFKFSADNVVVSNGCLNLTARFMREDEKTAENLARGFTTYATGIVRAKTKTFYGYYEARAKSMSSVVCNAFWLYDPLSDKPERKFRIGDFSEEIDIFEIFGSLKEYNATVHQLATPYLEGIVHGGVTRLTNKSKTLKLAFAPDEEFHVYGFEWREGTLTWYIDGEKVFSRVNDCYHRPLHVTFDCEIMYAWHGEPKADDLPDVFSVDYFRYYPEGKK